MWRAVCHKGSDKNIARPNGVEASTEKEKAILFHLL